MELAELKYKIYRAVYNNYYYAVKDFFFPHNVIKMKALPRRWTDRCEVLIHAPFQVLCDFVEHEHPFEIETCDVKSLYAAVEERHKSRLKSDPDYQSTSDRIAESYRCERTCVELYEWYQRYLKTPYRGWNYPEEYTPEFELLKWTEFAPHLMVKAEHLAEADGNSQCFNVMYHLEKLIDDEINEKLHQLISIRVWLWT